MKVYVIGGFLGAGKTTLVRALARRLDDAGQRVAVITNDQGSALVDSSVVKRVAHQVREITGGCFCCRFDDLEAALVGAEGDGATVAVAEAVGSCTDLVATVIAPLCDRFPDRFQVAPLAIVADPFRVQELDELSADVGYLVKKQLEEADVILLSRGDLSPPDVTATLRALNPVAPLVRVSGKTGAGVDEWLAAKIDRLAPPLVIDYDRYAAAEARLGWCNARVQLQSRDPFSPSAVMQAFLANMADAPIAHLKLVSLVPEGVGAAIVRAGEPPAVDGLASVVRASEWLVNARIELAPEALVERLQASLAAAAPGIEVRWSETEAFRPSRPVPRHRYSFRAGAVSAETEAACCAAFYERADVRALLGDSWHPGGVGLTLAMGERLGLAAGKTLLDVACGQGTSLRALCERWPIAAIGIDARPPSLVVDRIRFARGDAHQLTFDDASFDAILCECALSTFLDQPAALAEMRRVTRPRGRIAVSDMCIEGALPDTLKEWVHTGTCLSRAMTAAAYAQLLRDAGLAVVAQWDASDGLHQLLRRIKRNLVGAAFASATGQMTSELRVDLKHARAVLREAEAAVRTGVVRYTALIAER
jgi:ubiquinone/menaquinone biosynthesis C-methylase UbiE/Ni2+-binding GTPase involved in maturation of urease and hydrogenase